MDRPDPRWLPPQPATAPPAPGAEPHLPAGHTSWVQRVGGTALVIGAFLLKFGKSAFVVLKGAKFLTASASMLVSIAAYSLIWGWRFAAGFVVLLLIHELGHYIQLRREGVTPSGMLFIPFLGAVVGARSLGGNALAEARVGLAGPIIGSLAAAACIPVHHLTGNDMFLALAFLGFFLNLFNLLPVVPLDGGRAMAAMAPWTWFVGLAAIAVLAFTFPNPVILLILVFAALETYRRWRSRRRGEEGNADYYRVRPRHRALVGAVYLGLIAALVLGMDATYLERTLADA
jgi:Zn-dependent protease